MFKTGLSYTLIGMGTVFLMLLFISLVIWLIGRVVGGVGRKTAPSAPAAETVEQKPAPEAVAEPETGGISNEIIAVISAAIAAFNAKEAAGGDSYVVRSIRRR
jgi:sodium pump decarboxylase gamma subunit